MYLITKEENKATAVNIIYVKRPHVKSTKIIVPFTKASDEISDLFSIKMAKLEPVK
jgi:hypothetical protein